MVHGQNTDSVQPDSLYRKYKVRTRSSSYEGSPSKSKEIFVFNEKGKYAGFILTDNETGKVPQMKICYIYNESGILSAESDTSYKKSGIRVKTAAISYSATGEMQKKSLTVENELVSEINYSAVERTETENLYRNGSVYREQKTFYDDHQKKVRFTGIELGDKNAQPKVFVVNGKSYTVPAKTDDEKWDYIFKNYYDGNGNLIGQERYVDNKLADKMEYFYDKRGLLVKQKVYGNQIIKFEYTYY